MFLWKELFHSVFYRGHQVTQLYKPTHLKPVRAPEMFLSGKRSWLFIYVEPHSCHFLTLISVNVFSFRVSWRLGVCRQNRINQSNQKSFMRNWKRCFSVTTVAAKQRNLPPDSSVAIQLASRFILNPLCSWKVWLKWFAATFDVSLYEIVFNYFFTEKYYCLHFPLIHFSYGRDWPHI